MLQLPVKFVNIDSCESEHAPKCSRLQFLVKRNNSTDFSIRSYFGETDGLPEFPEIEKPNELQRILIVRSPDTGL